MIEANAELLLLDAFDEGVVAIDQASRIVFFNRSAERMFGYSADEVVGQALDLLIPQAHRAAHQGQVDRFRQSGLSSRMMGQRRGISALRKGGGVFEAEASIARARVDGREVLLAVVRDVTERNRAEARLRALEQRQRAILETCADAILLIDADTGVVIDANSRAGALFGCGVAELSGLQHRDLYPVDGSGSSSGAAAPHAARLDYDPDAVVRRLDGTTLPVEITRRTTGIDGRPTVVEFLRDISYRKSRERELVKAREEARLANDSKTRFLANMSHELRTPLNAVIGMSEMIREGFWGPLGHPKYAEYAADINDSGRHLLDLINDILDLSRIELDKVALRDEEIALSELVEQCRRTVQGLLHDRALTWIDRVGGREMLVGDRRAVRQMLLNLLSNAIKHTPKGGRIAVAAQPGRDGGLVVTVADTGAGIPPQRLTSILEPFNLDIDISVSRQGGTGLGLAITQRLIQRHGGELRVDSVVGEGTSVHLVFPAERVAAAG